MRPSTATSAPGTRSIRSGPSGSSPASARIARTRADAAAAACGSSARSRHGSPTATAALRRREARPRRRPPPRRRSGRPCDARAAALRRPRARAASPPCRASRPRPPAGCREPQPLGSERGHAHSLVVDGHHRVERTVLRKRRDRLRGRLRPAQVERQLGVAHRDEPPLGRHHDLGAERAGGGEEVGRPVGGRRQQEEHTSHAGSIDRGR